MEGDKWLFDITAPVPLISDESLARSWNEQSEEEKYAEWSEYAEHWSAGADLSYVEYCNQWEK